MGARYRRFPGTNTLLRALFGLKSWLRGGQRAQPSDAAPSPDVVASGALGDDTLTGARATRAAHWLARHSRRERIAANRRRNYALFSESLVGLPGTERLTPQLPDFAVPYVFPLRVENPEPVYRTLRAAGVPVFRWDVIWPGTPDLPGDDGRRWATEVLQLGCHQDLSEADVRDIAATVRRAVEGAR
jgi:hypothetical protein